MCVCVCITSQRATCRGQCSPWSPSAMRVPGVELRSSGLVEAPLPTELPCQPTPLFLSLNSPCSLPLHTVPGQLCQACGWHYRMMEKLLLGERNAGPHVRLLGVLVLGVRAEVVIYQRLCIGQRVLHRKQAWAGILWKRGRPDGCCLPVSTPGTGQASVSLAVAPTSTNNGNVC